MKDVFLVDIFSPFSIFVACGWWCAKHRLPWKVKCKWSGQCDGCSECDSVDERQGSDKRQEKAEGESFREETTAQQTDTVAGTETTIKAHANSVDCEKLASFVGFILFFSFFSI